MAKYARLVALGMLLGCAALAGQTPPAPISPTISLVAPVHPQILSVVIEHGRVTVQGIEPYTPKPGDEIANLDSRTKVRWLRRSGTSQGSIVGRDRTHLWKFDIFQNEPLDTQRATNPEAWVVKSGNERLTISKIDRKSKPIGMARTGESAYGWPMRHTLYLHLPHPIAAGEDVSVELTGHMPAIPPALFRFDASSIRTPAIALSHVGFAPQDTKTAFLSQWRGDGGATSYPDGISFSVIDVATDAKVHSGQATLAFKAGSPEDNAKVDHTRTDVLWMDFSTLQKPGEYKVVVDGIGCSYPFKISADVYRELFVTSAHGLMVHRSGIGLGPPLTSYVRPRPMHPADGFPIYQADTRAFEPTTGANGQNDAFKRLQLSPKEQTVANAWGGYMDAGDWDRRINHLIASRLFLELTELRPEFVRQTKLAIPENNNDLPDLVDEALWGIDCYRRMQRDDGGVPGWIESIEHPRQGDVSWLESLDVFVMQPDPHASFWYAATATQAATVLRSLGKAQLADTYLDSALKAFDWAEARHTQDGFEAMSRDPRHLAALLLYRETGEPRFHEIFLATTVFRDKKQPLSVYTKHDQREAAFIYARLSGREKDETIAANARAAILREAELWGGGISSHGFRFVSEPGSPISWGALGTPRVWSAARAYELTGDAKYREIVQVGLGFILGANPFGQSTITGVGPAPAMNPLHVDSRTTGRPAPKGISTYGPIDPERNKNFWSFSLIKGHIHPTYTTWPSTEAYFDVFWITPSNEYTVHQSLGPNTYLFGMLAGR